MASKTVSQRRWRDLILGLALLSITTVIMAIGFELVSRAKFGTRAPFSTRGMLRPSADFSYPLHEWTPGARGIYRGLPLRINRDGFIGGEYSKHRLEGIQRIVVIGDSIAAGWGLERISDSFANRLEQRLNKAGMAVEVLNLAVPGYDAYESVVRLKSIGIAFQPDVIVYVLCTNDMLHAAGHPTPEVTRASNYDERSFLWHFTWWRFAYLQKVSAAGQHIPYRTVVGDKTVPMSEDKTLEQLHSQIDDLTDSRFFRDRADGYDSRLGIGHFEYAMRQLASMGAEHGFHTLVVTVPHLSSHQSDGRLLAYKIVSHILEKYALTQIDLMGAYQSIGFDELRSVDWDNIHPNARGHAEMARAVAPRVRQRIELTQ